MNEPDAHARIDSALVPFVCAASEREAKEQLNELMAQAAPGIAKITRISKTPEDAFQDAAHRLIKQLRELRAQAGSSSAISNYSHYVKVVASRVVKGQVREEHPKHRSMVDSLRHVLKRDTSFALWERDGQRHCGFAVWRDEQLSRVASERLIRLLEEPRVFEDLMPSNGSAANMKPAELLRLLFGWIGHPIRFDELTRIVCGIKRIKEPGPISAGEGTGRELSGWLPDRRRRPDEQAEWKEFLRCLWRQIEQLPRLQRLAYLLNFTAADGQLELFWAYGVASIRRIGAALEIAEKEFEQAWAAALDDRMRQRAAWCEQYDDKFAILWQMLPLPDAVIARMLGTERQKVINLRKAAADRLSRQMIEPAKTNSF